VRTLCRHCRKPYKPDQDEMDELGLPLTWRRDPNLKFYKPNGCPACDYGGYTGRCGLFEFLDVDEKICDMILDRAMAFEIRQYARKNQGMLVLREGGLMKCAQGVTSAEEVIAHTDLYED